MTLTITPAELPAAAAQPVIDAAEAHDGIAPLSEQYLAGLADATLRHRHLLAREGGEVAGVAALAPDGNAELVVAPAHRRRGVGRALIDALENEAENPLLWAHGNLPAAQATAESIGVRPVRELLVMAVDAAKIDRRADAPAGYELVSYPQAVARFGEDEVKRQWLEVNNDAFSWHPEQGGWDLDRLRRGMGASWFDPEGVWLLYAGDELAGFHWTKQHPGGVGEVYVIGLSSRHRGQGLGAPLLEAGLRFLVERGSSQVILYVESDNEPAVRRYVETGFTIAESHVVYQKPQA